MRASDVIGLEYTGVDSLRSGREGSVYVVELNSTHLIVVNTSFQG